MSLVALRHYLCTNPTYLGTLLRYKWRQLLRFRWVEANARTDRKVPPPLVYKITLTERCNLACTMCMNITDREATPQRSGRSIDYDVLVRLFSDVGASRPSVILSGGEPMLHPRFADVIELLESARIPTTVCTNGTALAKHLPLFQNKRHILPTLSLDGLRSENDAIRGDGVYDTVTSGIRRLRQQSRRRTYIGIQHTIRPENVASMHAFCKAMVALDVDWILLNPCWHMSKEQAAEHSDFMRNEYGVAARSQLGYVMDYALDTEIFAQQYAKIKAERWPIQISCYYDHPAQDVRKMQAGERHFSGNTLCYKQWIRMDIMSDGKVVSCQQFPDLVLGDLHRQSWDEVWNGASFRSFRGSILQRPLPVCNQCAPLYLYDRRRLRL